VTTYRQGKDRGDKLKSNTPTKREQLLGTGVDAVRLKFTRAAVHIDRESDDACDKASMTRKMAYTALISRYQDAWPNAFAIMLSAVIAMSLLRPSTLNWFTVR
jgi:hypothetical protein